jgi:hypothetical protein
VGSIGNNKRTRKGKGREKNQKTKKIEPSEGILTIQEYQTERGNRKILKRE